ncbi:hypothetical protein [Paenibacillus planticolens]|uniref:Uncharacterized protein n=1 Tax=Paenibacillus planticolens TaxID=2654976 RepID=A0ABX1ZVA9_9BACL|nr:hypothetical protein [Paenibacillus planticolens]NOV03932.1 hypothetical protein [Paenibacillus planticolens]
MALDQQFQDVAIERLIGTIPLALSSIYRGLIQDPEPELYRWVKAADLIGRTHIARRLVPTIYLASRLICFQRSGDLASLKRV